MVILVKTLDNQPPTNHYNCKLYLEISLENNFADWLRPVDCWSGHTKPGSHQDLETRRLADSTTTLVHTSPMSLGQSQTDWDLWTGTDYNLQTPRLGDLETWRLVDWDRLQLADPKTWRLGDLETWRLNYYFSPQVSIESWTVSDWPRLVDWYWLQLVDPKTWRLGDLETQLLLQSTSLHWVLDGLRLTETCGLVLTTTCRPQDLETWRLGDSTTTSVHKSPLSLGQSQTDWDLWTGTDYNLQTPRLGDLETGGLGQTTTCRPQDLETWRLGDSTTTSVHKSPLSLGRSQTDRDLWTGTDYNLQTPRLGDLETWSKSWGLQVVVCPSPQVSVSLRLAKTQWRLVDWSSSWVTKSPSLQVLGSASCSQYQSTSLGQSETVQDSMETCGLK